MNRYQKIIERVFLDRYRPGDIEVSFLREDLIDAARQLDLPVPRNLGDILYAFRYRTDSRSPLTMTTSSWCERSTTDSSLHRK